MTPFQAARSSVATVRITMTKSAVATISSTRAAQSSIPIPGAVCNESVTCRRVDDRHHEHRPESADELGDPVRDDVARGESPGNHGSERDRGIEVPAGEVPEGRDREREPETEACRDAKGCDRAGADVDQNGDAAEAEEEEEERSERFCAEAHAERLIHVTPPWRV